MSQTLSKIFSVLPRLSKKKHSGPRKKILEKPQNISKLLSLILKVNIKWSKIYTWMRLKNKKDKNIWCHLQRSDNSWMVSRPSGKLSIRSTKISLISEWLILLDSREKRNPVKRNLKFLKKILKNSTKLTFLSTPPDDFLNFTNPKNVLNKNKPPSLQFVITRRRDKKERIKFKLKKRINL